MSNLVSVVVPTYNREATIGRTIDSILNQTYKHFEIIIVDDNSNDNTEQLVKQYMEKYPNILYHKHQVNKGGSAARNTGIRTAKGDFIAFLDSDDEWINTKLEKEMNLFNTHPEIDMIYSNIYIIDVDNNNKITLYKQEDYEDKFYGMLCKNIIGSTSSIIVRKNIFDTVKGFNESLPSCQDWDLYLRIAEKFNIYKIDEPLLKYYLHGNSISGSLERVLKGHEIMINNVEKILKTNSTYNMNRKKIIASHYLNFGHIYLRFNKFDMAKKFFYKAFLLNPMERKIMKNAIGSLLGEKIYFKLRSLSNL